LWQQGEVELACLSSSNSWTGSFSYFVIWTAVFCGFGGVSFEQFSWVSSW
jgi:hypothetical protein